MIKPKIDEEIIEAIPFDGIVIDTPPVVKKKRAPGRAKTQKTEINEHILDAPAELISATLVAVAYIFWQDMQPVLPTIEEYSNMLRPLGHIIARRIDISVGMSRDVEDMLAIAMAMVAYAMRAQQAAEHIKKEKEKEVAAHGSQNPDLLHNFSQFAQSPPYAAL